MTIGGWNIAKIEVKGQRSSKIWQPLKKDIKSHSFVTVSRQKWIFGRRIEVHGGMRHVVFPKLLFMLYLQLSFNKAPFGRSRSSKYDL